MSRSEGRIPLPYSRDTRRLLNLVVLALIASFCHSFSVQPSRYSSCIGARRFSSTVSIRQSQYNSHTRLYMAPKKTEPEEDEWKALLAALHMYKAAYGDLKVPLRFIVPGMPPWPGKNAILRSLCVYFLRYNTNFLVCCLDV